MAYIHNMTDGGGYVAPKKTSTDTTGSSAPTSGAVPSTFKPSVTMGNPTNNMFIGPIPTGTTRTATGYTTPEPVKPEKTVTSTSYKGAGANRVKVTTWSDGTTSEEPAPDNSQDATKTVTRTFYRGSGAERIMVTEYSDGTSSEVAAPVTPVTTITEAPTRSLAKDTFVNTLKLTLGAQEASKPYVTKLYDLVSGYYKSGSTEDEALNLAIRDAYENNAIPEFTNRFKGIFALQDKLRAGQAITVPTVAEYIATEAKMGEVLNNAGLGDLATQEFLGGVIGKGKSVLEVGNLISDVFTAIDTAPTELKTTLQTYFPGVDRVSIAKALLTGPEGAAALAQKVKGATTLSAAATQGLTVDLATATDIANMGYGYQESLAGFGKVATALPTYEKLQEMNLGQNIAPENVQAQLQKAIFASNIAEQEKMRKAAEQEANRFKATAGLLSSKSLASQQRGAGLI